MDVSELKRKRRSLAAIVLAGYALVVWVPDFDFAKFRGLEDLGLLALVEGLVFLFYDKGQRYALSGFDWTETDELIQVELKRLYGQQKEAALTIEEIQLFNSQKDVMRLYCCVLDGSEGQRVKGDLVRDSGARVTMAADVYGFGRLVVVISVVLLCLGLQVIARASWVTLLVPALALVELRLLPYLLSRHHVLVIDQIEHLEGFQRESLRSKVRELLSR